MSNKSFTINNPLNICVCPFTNCDGECNTMRVSITGDDRYMVSLLGFMDAGYLRNIDGWNYGNGDPISLMENYASRIDEKNCAYDLAAAESIAVRHEPDRDLESEHFELEILFKDGGGLQFSFVTAEVYKLEELVL